MMFNSILTKEIDMKLIVMLTLAMFLVACDSDPTKRVYDDLFSNDDSDTSPTNVVADEVDPTQDVEVPVVVPPDDQVVGEVPVGDSVVVEDVIDTDALLFTVADDQFLDGFWVESFPLIDNTTLIRLEGEDVVRWSLDQVNECWIAITGTISPAGVVGGDLATEYASVVVSGTYTDGLDLFVTDLSGGQQSLQFPFLNSVLSVPTVAAMGLTTSCL